jgi:F-type H+-transporting ATPase subunit b
VKKGISFRNTSFFTLPNLKVGVSRKGKTMISIDQSLFYQIVNFLLLMILLNIILYRPIRTVLKQRAEKVTSLTEEAQKAREEMIRREREYQEALQQARKEGFEQKNLYKLQGQEEEKRILEETNRRLEAELAQKRKKIAEEVEEARKKLSGEITSFSREIAQKILGRTI